MHHTNPKIGTLFSSLLFATTAYATSFNVGCYNIRFINDGDTGETAWASRKEYVAKTITDNNYDIIGINEMRSGQQRNDMLSMLPEYTFVGWGSDSATDSLSGTVNSVLFRTDKFELLDEGHFFLSKNIERPQISWDCSTNKRLTVWAKLKVKETGEILFYFITHLDHQGSDARNEGARINMEQIRKITGHYPAIITGDHNSSTTRYPFYDLFTAYMKDARKVSTTAFPWSKDGTLCKWDPTNTSGTRIDYIWVKGATVNTYNHINETYGRSMTPSDHFPIIANITLDEYVEEHTRYVDASASVDGDGSISSPFNTLQKAIDNTCTGDTIYVAEGDYAITETEELSGKNATINVSHSLTIIGGYNRDFTSVTGRSKVNGNKEVYRVMTVQPSCALELSNFEISGGNASETVTSGAGIACLGSRCILDNVVVRDNYAKGSGGGVYAAGQLVCNGCQFINNTAISNGGAFYTNYTGATLWWRYTIDGCYFEGNTANQGSAGYISGFSWAYIGQNTFSNNIAKHSGTLSLGGVAIESRATIVNNTFVNNSINASAGAINEIKGGSAIFARVAAATTIAIINNTIVGNHATCGDEAPEDFHGAAINIYSGTPYIYSNIIICNTTNAANGADVYNDGETTTTRFNLYTTAESTNYTLNRDDLKGSSTEAALNNAAKMYGCSVENGVLKPELSWESNIFPVLALKSSYFGDDAINILPYAFYNESMLHGDVDNNLDTSDKLINDQRGLPKNIDSTGYLGSYEYGKMSSIESIFSPENKSTVTVSMVDGSIVLSSNEQINNVALYTISGMRCINIGTLPIGNSEISTTNLATGVYIITWNGGAKRVFIR